MTAIRSVHASEGKFVQISNALIRNEELSVLARFIVCYVLSLPPDHHFTAEWLETRLPGYGTRSIRAALGELKSHGYMKVTRRSGGRGRWLWEQVISDAPIGEPSPGPREDSRDPDLSSEPNRTDEVTSGNAALMQVVSSERPSSDEPSSDDGRSDKELNTEDPKHVKNQKMASRRGRASGAAARTLTDEDKIQGTRAAITAAYGTDASAWLADSEVLALYESKAPANGKVRSAEAYMSKIFDDTPDLDTLIAALDADGSDDYDLAAETGARGECPRCNSINAAIGETGVCVWCEEELKPDAGEGWNRAILNTVIVQLRIRTGYEADDAWAARVAGHILGDAPKGTVVRHPAAYIRKTIEDDPHPERFTPTPIPGRAA